MGRLPGASGRPCGIIFNHIWRGANFAHIFRMFLCAFRLVLVYSRSALNGSALAWCGLSEDCTPRVWPRAEMHIQSCCWLSVASVLVCGRWLSRYLWLCSTTSNERIAFVHLNNSRLLPNVQDIIKSKMMLRTFRRVSGAQIWPVTSWSKHKWSSQRKYFY